jgi:hypothetical protein
VCHINPGKDAKEMLQLLLLDPTSQLQHYISCIQVGRGNSVSLPAQFPLFYLLYFGYFIFWGVEGRRAWQNKSN